MKKKYENLKFTDDFAFCYILKENEEICRRITELITGRKVSRIVSLQKQKIIKESPDGKGVRFDVYFEDDENIYDIEMQTRNEGDLSRRARYYHSLSDLISLKEGEEYESIKNSCVIFICTFDPFGAGLCKYTVQSGVVGHPEIDYEDGMETIFVSSDRIREKAGEMISDEMKAFLTYLDSDSPTDELTRMIDESLAVLLGNEDRRSEYMTFEEICERARREGRKQGLAEGREQGLAEGKAEGETKGKRLVAEEIAKKMLKDDMSVETVSRYSGLTEEEVMAIKDSISA